jgi:glycosyltransferase involved in cell wall biosynthesis
MTTITTVIPLFNRAHVVRRAVESVLTQSLPGPGWSVEVVVVDDGSTDAPKEVLASLGTKVRLLRHERNLGAAAARSTGIAAARGEYVAFLDSDDTWAAGKLATQVRFMQANDAAISCTACLLSRSGGAQVVWPHYRTGRLTASDLIWGCFLSPGTTMICKRGVFADVGLFDPTLQRYEDWDWLLRATARHDIAYLAEPLARVEPSAAIDTQAARGAAGRLRAKHLSMLEQSRRRKFEAALVFNDAALHYRDGSLFDTLAALGKSLWMAPIGHRAFTTLLLSRLALLDRRRTAALRDPAGHRGSMPKQRPAADADRVPAR